MVTESTLSNTDLRDFIKGTNIKYYFWWSCCLWNNIWRDDSSLCGIRSRRYFNGRRNVLCEALIQLICVSVNREQTTLPDDVIRFGLERVFAVGSRSYWTLTSSDFAWNVYWLLKADHTGRLRHQIWPGTCIGCWKPIILVDDVIKFGPERVFAVGSRLHCTAFQTNFTGGHRGRLYHCYKRICFTLIDIT